MTAYVCKKCLYLDTLDQIVKTSLLLRCFRTFPFRRRRRYIVTFSFRRCRRYLRTLMKVLLIFAGFLFRRANSQGMSLVLILQERVRLESQKAKNLAMTSLHGGMFGYKYR